MSPMRRASTWIWSAFLALSTASPARAAAAGHHEPSWSLTLLGFVNLAIFLFILKRYAWPLVQSYLEDRRDAVVRELEAARQAKAAADQLRAEFEARMQTLESEAERTREELLSIARVEAQRLLDQAQRAAERIRKDARLIADQEVAHARRLLQQETADLIADRAAALLTREITPQDQQRLVQEFVRETGAVNR
jgi:F-type H+-transporting ATPase subunit b